MVQQGRDDVQVDERGVGLLLIVCLNRLYVMPFQFLQEGVYSMLRLSLEIMATTCVTEAVAVLYNLIDFVPHLFNRRPFHSDTPAVFNQNGGRNR
jgi:hypothetical protein